MFEISVKMLIKEIGKYSAFQKYYRDYKHGIITGDEFAIVKKLIAE